MVIILGYTEEDGLKCSRYTFCLIGENLVLDYVKISERKTKDEHFTDVDIYDRTRPQNGTLREAGVFLTDNVKDDAMKEMFRRVAVCKWSEIQDSQPKEISY